MLENAVGRATRIRIGALLEQSALESVEAALIQLVRHVFSMMAKASSSLRQAR